MNRPVVELVNFSKHLDKTVEALMDSIAVGEYKEEYDIKLEINGKSIVLENDADTYCALDSLLMNIIIERANVNMDDLRWLGIYQEYRTKMHGELPFFFTFYRMTTRVINPFHVEPVGIPVDPVQYYGKSFIRSTWITEAPAFIERLRVTALEYCQLADGGGCYTDNLYKSEYGTTLPFSEAFKRFVYNAGSDIIEYKDLMEDPFGEALEIVMGMPNHYAAICDMLVMLTLTNEKEQAMRNIFDYGVSGYIDGKFTIDILQPRRSFMICGKGTAREIKDMLNKAIQEE